jgi:hypothetical protein
MPGLRVMVLALVAAKLAGCAALREPGELGWQAMHVIDTMQTLQISKDPRYKEVESAWLIGEYPDQKTVFAWSVGLAVAHAGVTELLINNDLPMLAKAWQYVTLSSLCHTVSNNAAIGIQIGSRNSGPPRNFRPLSAPRSQIEYELGR